MKTWPGKMVDMDQSEPIKGPFERIMEAVDTVHQLHHNIREMGAYLPILEELKELLPVLHRWNWGTNLSLYIRGSDGLRKGTPHDIERFRRALALLERLLG